MLIQLKNGDKITATQILFNPGESFISYVNKGPESYTVDIDDVYSVSNDYQDTDRRTWEDTEEEEPVSFITDQGNPAIRCDDGIYRCEGHVLGWTKEAAINAGFRPVYE